MLSRQEELKERARVLLEQARRDAAAKAGSKHAGSAASPLSSGQQSDVRNTVCTDHTLFTVITAVLGSRGVARSVTFRGLYIVATWSFIQLVKPSSGTGHTVTAVRCC